MSDEDSNAVDLLAKYAARDDASTSLWMELVFRSGDKHALLLRELLSVKYEAGKIVLGFTRFRVQVRGYRLQALYQSIIRLECRQLGESRDPAAVFEETPGAIAKIDVDEL